MENGANNNGLHQNRRMHHRNHHRQPAGEPPQQPAGEPPQQQNGDNIESKISPGYRFCPTDQELIRHYLAPRLAKKDLPWNKIHEINIYKYSPQDLASRYKSSPLLKPNEWYFFTPTVRKHTNGCRPSRTASDGFWKLTGFHAHIKDNGQIIGYRKNLDYYQGTQKSWIKTYWKMHEYIIHREGSLNIGNYEKFLDECVLCKLYKNTRAKGEKDEGIGGVLMNDQNNGENALIPNDLGFQINEQNNSMRNNALIGSFRASESNFFLTDHTSSVDGVFTGLESVGSQLQFDHSGHGWNDMSFNAFADQFIADFDNQFVPNDHIVEEPNFSCLCLSDEVPHHNLNYADQIKDSFQRDQLNSSIEKM